MGNKIDIVIPCYNPHPNWAIAIVQNIKILQALYPTNTMQCIVVNDGSTIGFSEQECNVLLKELPTTQILQYPKNKGKGFALRYGMQQSNASYKLYTDLDFPFTLQSMQQVIDTLLQGTDIVLGKREKSYDNQLYPYRKFLSKLSKIFNETFLRMKTTDTQGGLKAFNETGKNIFLQTKINRYLFDTEFILLASKQKNIETQEISIATKPGIHLSEMGFAVLKKEISGVFRLLFIQYLQK
jgi:glycosyltransferase involved in cell wall biosynthesis